MTLSLEELHNLLICEELALADDYPEQSQAFAAFRPPKSTNGHGFPSTLSRGNSSGCESYPHRYNNEKGLLPLPQNTDKSGARPQCQICQKMGHLVIDCYHRMDYTYRGRHPPEKLSAMVLSALLASYTWVDGGMDLGNKQERMEKEGGRLELEATG
ncbi:hypothetical protein NE237_012775 [Protea cynaroides]|uniref:Uncharacterized protein n=1 Tax=Protea cynaroides TaxID=273540 RepID=A0A9Q0H1P7_9MAGN|nr:hypothetical protein NE237_012775 [Protea cynaroides]